MSRQSETKVSVRPVQWNKLLDAIELVIGKNEVSTDLFERYMNISSNQSQEIARVLHNMGLVERDGTKLKVLPLLSEFVRYWEQGDLRGLSHLLQKNYLPYNRCIEFVRDNGPVYVPEASKEYREFEELLLEECSRLGISDDHSSMREAANSACSKLCLSIEIFDEYFRIFKHIQALKKALKRYGLNLNSFDTLTRMAARLGGVYIIQDHIYFSENQPGQEEFERILLEEYAHLRIHSGYANMGEIADSVCRKLGISMLDFDKYFKTFYDANYDRLRTSSSVMLKPEISKEIIFLQKRGAWPRFDRRRLVDGVNVYYVNIKSLKVLQNAE